jgi:hypothetical protein
VIGVSTSSTPSVTTLWRTACPAAAERPLPERASPGGRPPVAGQPRNPRPTRRLRERPRGA